MTAAQEFRVTVEHGAAHRMVLSGRLDLLGAPTLLGALGRLLRDSQVRRVEIDATRLESCDSVGLRALASAQLRAADLGVPLQLVRSHQPLRGTGGHPTVGAPRSALVTPLPSQ